MSEHTAKVFQVNLLDKASVYNTYMIFAKDGGLFIPSSHDAHVGEQILLIVRLPDNPESHIFSSKVVWISHGRRRGFGVRFSGDEGGRKLKIAIENLLTTQMQSAVPNYTM